MKNYKIIYWTSTGLFVAYMFLSAYTYLTNKEIKGAFEHLGFTQGYFRIELAVAKILGALALIVPSVPKTLKGFAYAGFTINLISATVAHIAMDYNAYALLIFAIITLSISYFAYLKIQPKYAIV
ncbi:MAG: DoxX family protein [Flavobacteriales bacterium]